MDLFADQKAQHIDAVTPLAVRMRPRSLDEFVGQEHFIGKGKLLRRLLAADRLSSAIFYGPPGSGKTTLAGIIASMTRARFRQVNAAAVGVKEIREILAESKALLEMEGRRTVLFVDELHRFNRAQQDVLLGDVEDGIVILLGATTQNPFFAVNAPLMSRSQVFEFKALDAAQIALLLRRALVDAERGLGRWHVTLTNEAVDVLAEAADGDARRALSALEIAVRSQCCGDAPEAGVVVDGAVAADSIQRKLLQYDASGDEHYDCASALIKSIRGSDADAAVYWLARMLESGEDPRFVARRVVIAASEEVGNADPQALVVAQSAAAATEFVGLPECQLILAQAVIYLACAPKSNAAAVAIWEAAEDVREGRTIAVPRHLKDTHYGGSKRLGSGAGYAYAHDRAGGIVAGQHMGVDKEYYRPGGEGFEAELAARLARVRAVHREAEEPGEE